MVAHAPCFACRFLVQSSSYSPFAKKYTGVLRIGANGSFGLLFYAANRRGTFPPNIPAGLKDAAPLSGAEAQSALAISAHAQCVCSDSL